MAGDLKDEPSFPHKLLLTFTQVSRLRKPFENNSSAIISIKNTNKVSKAQMYKIVESRGFSGRIFGPILETALPLIKHVLKPSAKRLLILLGRSSGRQMNA